MSVRALGAAASGISTMETDLDVIGNDIANSETDGYASQTAEFSDVLTEQLQPAGAASGNTQASTNPSAVGAGDEVSAVETNFANGAVIQTGIPTDVAIQGNGFLVVSQGGQTYYTQDGDLQIDSNGNLATNSGGLIEGWAPGVATTTPPTPIRVVVGSAIPPEQTQNIDIGGNLESNATSPVTVTTTMYDSLGDEVPVTLTLTPTGTNTWSVQGTVTGAADALWNTPLTVVFASDGELASINGAAVGTGQTNVPIDNDPSNYTFTGTPSLDFAALGSANALTQFADDQTVSASSDGYGAGTLESYSIGSDGVITGSYSNGETQSLGTIALAQFSNPDGLQDTGQTYYAATAASGAAQIGQPGTGGLGTLQGGAVDGSNVDLATELTDLIEAQTAYQANTKVVSTVSAALQSLVEMS